MPLSIADVVIVFVIRQHPRLLRSVLGIRLSLREQHVRPGVFRQCPRATSSVPQCLGGLMLVITGESMLLARMSRCAAGGYASIP